MDASSVADETRQELLEQYHDINVDHDWWEFVYEDFRAEMREKGIRVDDINFSGFWSQGDGASFEGAVPITLFSQFMDLHDLSARYPASRYFSEHHELRLDINRTSSHYCHENTVEASLQDTTGNPYDEDSPRWDIYDTMQTLFEHEFAALELECEEIVRGYMRELYSKLAKEHEYLTSEEVVWETILANELHKQVA